MLKIIQPGRFLGKVLGPLIKFDLPPAKNVLATSRLTVAASAVDEKFIKKFLVQERRH